MSKFNFNKMPPNHPCTKECEKREEGCQGGCMDLLLYKLNKPNRPFKEIYQPNSHKRALCKGINGGKR